MPCFRTLVFFGFMLGLCACAIPTRQTDSFLHSSRDIPELAKVEGVPFIHQDENYCGPASLAMVLAHAGHPVPVNQLASEVYTPGKKGTLQSDLIGSARRNGMMAVEISGIPALMGEIAAGHPVVIFENLGLSWYPLWHYAVAFGYDLNGPDLILHSGPDQAKRIDLRKFERSWQESNYWGLVVLSPGQISSSADELAHAAAAAGLEHLGKSREAEIAYLSILKKWKHSLIAYIGMGNIRYTQGDYQGSVDYLEQAVQAYPNSLIAWHNLANAQGGAHLRRLARASATRALELASPADTSSYRRSLHEWLGP